MEPGLTLLFRRGFVSWLEAYQSPGLCYGYPGEGTTPVSPVGQTRHECVDLWVAMALQAGRGGANYDSATSIYKG